MDVVLAVGTSPVNTCVYLHTDEKEAACRRSEDELALRVCIIRAVTRSSPLSGVYSSLNICIFHSPSEDSLQLYTQFMSQLC